MPEYTYRGRDKEGKLRSGERFASSLDVLNNELIKEGIFPISIASTQTKQPLFGNIRDFIQGKQLQTEELATFSRQMQLLHQAGVPIVTAIKQLGANTRSTKLASALEGIVDQLEKGQSLATAMSEYPTIFTPLMVSLVQIGEQTGHLSEAFAHIYQYLTFESTSKKQIKTAMRYPTFVIISVLIAIVTLNLFVIPTFSKFYSNLGTALPWETVLLISISNIFVYYGIYLLIGTIGIGTWFYRYLHTPVGKYKWDRFLLKIPLVGNLLKRINLIRLSQSLSIILNSGISITQGLTLVKNTINNAYIADQLNQMQEDIERGVSFTQAILKVDLFSPLEVQILAVGEKNGELTPALNYIANFHGQEIEFDLKRMSDYIGPILIAIVSVLVLIIALGIYLPIWNMINLVHS